MAAVLPFTPQKLVVPMLIAADAAAADPPLGAVLAAIRTELGEVDLLDTTIPFSFTSYYEAEMGVGIVRRFVVARELVDPSYLPDVKLATDRIEGRFRREGPAGGGRTVNLDPGVLSLSRLILASTKDFSHRVPLRNGIYAEVTLIYTRGAFQALPWTFPDYQTREYHRVFERIREEYHTQLRSVGAI